MKRVLACCAGILLLYLLVANAQANYTVHGNVDSRIYHNARCRYFTCKKCTAVFSSPQEAQKNGYRPCKVCKG